ncbi:transcriptional regulator, ArsR family [Natranaerobius thermophilus JW/NM-WN-LF]|uniref:Transcriptional regulator, ArsR family n=2 Tax=Natranaerobius TaxID=375928 RepID=B2A0L2_NATTJ|nr:transcriptional regulator, ArsR family [Natranaerobius thermophilus JW/NM-WN-LF]
MITMNHIETIKALGDNTRFKIIELLISHDYCVGALANNLGLTKAAVSQHLKVLRQAGIVWGEKRGYFTHYTVNKEVLKELSELFFELHKQSRVENTTCNKGCHNK